MPTQYELVYVANGSFLGESIVALLKSFGIDAYVNLDTSGILTAMGEARVYVAAVQLKDAQQLLEQMERGKLQLSPLDLNDLPNVEEPEEGKSDR